MREAVIQGENEIAVTEDGKLVGYRRLSHETVQTGDIFWGRVVKCASGGTGGCFVDLGTDCEAFCAKRGDAAQGSFLPVMVVSAAHDNKPARVSFDIKIIGKYLVLLSQENACGVSGKISDIDEKKRLKEVGVSIIDQYTDIPGLIMRTEAARAGLAELKDEASRLSGLWSRIKEGKASPGLIYRPISYMDYLNRFSPLDSIITDSAEVYERLRSFYPDIRYRRHGDYSLFEVKNVSSQLASLTGRRVWLPSGGNIVIEHTEAMTVIDVNSGKATGNKAGALAVNLEAAREIMRQLRLRDIGGAIICDFIGMSPEDNDKVLETMQALAKNDFGKPRVYGFTKLGLVEISRRRN